MKTNDERVTLPFDSETSGAVRFRIKLSRPSTRQLAAPAMPPDRPADIGIHSDRRFPPQSSTIPFAADGAKAASTATRPAPDILRNALPGYLFIAVCICIAAAAFGAFVGYYIVSSSSPSPMFQTPSPLGRINPASQDEPSASEKMALKITEMRKIASEESEGTDTSMEDTKTMSSSTLPGTALAHSKDGGASALAVPATSPAQHCSAASLALALCGEK